MTDKPRAGTRVPADSDAIVVPGFIVRWAKELLTGRGLLVVAALGGIYADPLLAVIRRADPEAAVKATDVVAEELAVVRTTLEDLLIEVRGLRQDVGKAKIRSTVEALVESLRGVDDGEVGGSNEPDGVPSEPLDPVVLAPGEPE